MREHMLIEIADGCERFLAQHTRRDIRLTVLETFVAHEFTRTAVFLATLVAFEASLVQHQMIV